MKRKADMTLRFEGRSHRISLPEDGWLNRGKPDEEHRFLEVTDTDPPFRSVFLKRYRGRAAPAHDFLLALSETNHLGKGIPLFLGYTLHRDSHSREFHCYAFQCQKGVSLLSLNAHNPRASHDKTFTEKLLMAVLQSSLRAFQFTNACGYYYPDFSFENILVHYGRDGAVIIDIDSCFPHRETATANDCRQTWWTLFSEAGIGDIRFLNHTMAMGLAVVLVRALVEISKQGDRANAADIFRADPEGQRKLFRSLGAGDADAVSEVLKITNKRDAKSLVRIWNGLLGRMRRGESVSWGEILGFGLTVFSLSSATRNHYRSQKRPRPGVRAAPSVSSPEPKPRGASPSAKPRVPSASRSPSPTAAAASPSSSSSPSSATTRSGASPVSFFFRGVRAFFFFFTSPFVSLFHSVFSFPPAPTQSGQHASVGTITSTPINANTGGATASSLVPPATPAAHSSGPMKPLSAFLESLLPEPIPRKVSDALSSLFQDDPKRFIRQLECLALALALPVFREHLHRISPGAIGSNPVTFRITPSITQGKWGGLFSAVTAMARNARIVERDRDIRDMAAGMLANAERLCTHAVTEKLPDGSSVTVGGQLADDGLRMSALSALITRYLGQDEPVRVSWDPLKDSSALSGHSSGSSHGSGSQPPERPSLAAAFARGLGLSVPVVLSDLAATGVEAAGKKIREHCRRKKSEKPVRKSRAGYSRRLPRGYKKVTRDTA